MSEDITVLCNVSVPMGLIRCVCGERFRQGEKEGNTADRPDNSIVGFRTILEGPSTIVMPTCWALFKTTLKNKQADFQFAFVPQQGSVTVRVLKEDLENTLAWVATGVRPE